MQQFLNACTLASFYVPLAVAFALVQGITNKIFLSFGDFAMYAAFAAIYVGLAGLLAGNNTAVILAISLVLAVFSSSALGHFAATHVFAPLIGHTSQAFMNASIGVSIALQEVMRLQGGARDLWMMPLFDGAGQLQYSFETEGLRGAQKNTPYKVQLKLLEANTGKQLAMVEKVFKSDVDQDILPTKAPVVGIGYQPAPD